MRQNLSIKDVSERYSAFTEIARTRGILSIGISAFRYMEPDRSEQHDQAVPRKDLSDPSTVIDIDGWSDEEVIEQEITWPFAVSSFNILCKSTCDTILEPDSESFLIDHGFDFKRQKEFGITYTPPDPQSDSQEQASNTILSQLFSHLIRIKKAVVFHNGFIDLIFLYHNLYLPVPVKFATFICNLNQLFPGGIYDTKFITDVVLRYKSSFLEYVYYFLQRENVKNMMDDKTHVFVTFPELFKHQDQVEEEGNQIEYRNMKTKILESKPDNIETCPHYSSHGWCIDGISCSKSHNIDLILDLKRMREERQRKTSSKSIARSKKRMQLLSHFNDSLVIQEDQNSAVDDSNLVDVTGKVKSGAHRSGYDAFMTGYALACIITSHCSEPPFSRSTLHSKSNGLKSFMNCVFLTGKDMPMKIRKGNFDKTSKDHDVKLAEIRG